jgi:hypothetical protein
MEFRRGHHSTLVQQAWRAAVEVGAPTKEEGASMAT